MPLVFQKDGDGFQLGLWKIEEEVSFFEAVLPYRSDAVHPERAKQQLAARMALLSVYKDFPFDQVELLDGGKPVLRNRESAFSLSHCNGFAAAIVSKESELGIDIEPIHERVLKIEKKFLNKHELKLLESFNDVERVAYSTLFWSLKETMFKWWGKGGVDFSSEICIVDFEDNREGMAEVTFSKLNNEVFNLKYFQYEHIWISMLCK